MARWTARSNPGQRRDPESSTWPLVAVGAIILPQALIPAQYRVGPPSVVPAVETVALLVLLGIAARPGPVHRGARTVVLALVGALVVANAVAAARLVTLVLDDGDVDGVALSAGRLLVAATLVLVRTSSRSRSSTGSWTAAGPRGGSPTRRRSPTSSSRRPGRRDWPRRAGSPLRGPPLPRVHQPGRVQPHGCDAADPPGQGTDGPAVARLAGGPRGGPRPRDQPPARLSSIWRRRPLPRAAGVIRFV